MITSIRLVDFKNFADETLRIGPFTVIVGANASGKSNIQDAFRFLHGIGRGYTLAEIVGGKFGAGGQRVWQPIRGAVNEIIRFGQLAFGLQVEFKMAEGRGRYSIGIRMTTRGRFQVRYEELSVGDEQIYKYEIGQHDSDRLYFRGDSNKDCSARSRSIRVERDQPILTQFHESKQKMLPIDKICTDWLTGILDSMRFMDFLPDQIRQPALPGADVLGDRGENLPVVLEEICSDPDRQKILANWLRELTPMDVTGFEFPRDPSGLVHLMICEKDGRKIFANSASDGTLHLLAILATLLGANSKGLYFFEEVDNRIHAARQWLLLELIEKQTAKGGTQVVTTTHSPSLLTFVNEDTFEHTSVVCRPEDAGDAIIRPVAEMPNASELRTSQGLGRLLMGGWMETTLAFTEGSDENGENEG